MNENETTNIAQTMRDTIEELNHHEIVHSPADFDLHTPFHVSVPHARKVEDLSADLRAALLRDKPERRTGTATHMTLDSLIAWAIRFKGDETVMYADPSDQPSLTCVANYHAQGPREWDRTFGEAGAGFCDHRALYKFPLSEEWKRWKSVSAKALSREDLSDFIDTNILDFIEPTPFVLNGSGDNPAPWEERCETIARKIDGRFGQPHELVNLSRHITIHEASNLEVKANKDDGTTQLQFMNEHRDAEGRPLNLPGLFLIAIPVFEAMDPYRLVVRFSYKKNGPNVAFRLQVYQPEAAFRDAVQTECARAQAETGIPMFFGKPEALA